MIKYILILLFISVNCFAQTKHTIITPYSPGGPSDRAARVIASYEKNTNVVNIVAGKLPKGYEEAYRNKSIVISGESWIVSNPVMYGPEFNYDVMNNFEVFLIMNSPTVFFMKSTFNINNIIELKNNTIQDFRYSVSSAGFRISVEELLNTININGRPIPYKSGASQSILAVLREDVHFSIANLTSAIPFVSNNQIKILGINSEKRHSLIPEVLTIKEQIGKSLEYSSTLPGGTYIAIPKSMNKSDFFYWKNFIFQLSKNQKFIEDQSNVGSNVSLIRHEELIILIEKKKNIMKNFMTKYNIHPD